jgi:ubiquinone/menaquinone biosynthesis C-methylase UbiE
MTDREAEAEGFKARDAASYDDRAEAFDRFTEKLTRPLAERLIALAALSPGERVLDVGTGTGVVGLTAAREVGADGAVLGIDLSEGMLGFAAAKAARSGLTPPFEARRMDAEALELPDRSFDVVLSLFSLLHFPNPLHALTEMHRILRPGGRLAAGIGGPPPLASRSGVQQAVRHVVNRVRQAQGKLLVAPGFLESLVERRLSGHRDLEESALARHSHHRSAALAPLFDRAGFVDVRRDWLGHRLELADPEEFWEVQRTFSSIARKRLGTAPAETVAAIHDEFLEACRAVQGRGGVLAYPVAACYLTARR